MDFFHEDFGPRYNTAWAASGLNTRPPPGQVYNQMERGAKQSNLGIYLSDEWQIHPALLLSGALRWDYIHTAVDDESKKPPDEPADVTAAYAKRRKITNTPVTGSIGAILKLTPAWSTTAQISRAFRAPSGNELTSVLAQGTTPTIVSPDLQPERSTTYEAGLRYHAENLYINTTAYLSKYKDLIQLQMTDMPHPDGGFWYQRRNIGKARIAGLEIDGEWYFAREWALRFAVTRLYAKDRTNDVPLDGVPEIFGRLAVRYGQKSASWHADWVMRAANHRDRVNPARETPRAGYAIFDLYAGADFGRMFGPSAKGWKFVAGIENILNKAVHSQVAAEDVRYSRMVGNPLMEPGRSFVARLFHDF